MKIDLHTLVQRKLNWDDAIPDDLRPLWETHFQMMQEINNIKFNRAIIPKDAISLNINSVDTGDASKKIACVAIYARCDRSNGEFSCQLTFSRSTLVPDSMSQPRAELFAAVLNAHTGEVIKRSLGRHHQSSTKLTDSQIALHWISNSDKPLKQWVRNRVIEIRRFTMAEQWKYVQSKDMIADLETRKGIKTEQVNQDSVWKNNYEWMKLESSQFPTKTVKEIQLDKDEISTLKSEFIVYDTDDLLQLEWPIRNNNNGIFTYTTKECIRTSTPLEVLDIYQFLKYIIDPNKHCFKTVVGILALVYRFIAKLKEKFQNKSKGDIDNVNINTSSTSFTQAILSKHEIQRSENYFYQKATEEVKEFSKPSKYEKISSEKEKMFYCTG